MINEVFGAIREQILTFLESENVGDNIELEARLGRICSTITNERVALNVQHPVIIGRSACGVMFKSGVEPAFFERMKSVHAEAPVAASTDAVYFLHDNIRKIVSECRTAYQRKTRLRNITIYCPGCDYDVRVSFSAETGVPPEEVWDLSSEVASCSGDEASSEGNRGEGEKRQRVMCRALHVRHRKRESYAYEDYVVDFTTVSRSKNPEKSSSNVYEVEIEVTSPGYDKESFASMILNIPRGK